MMRGRYGSRYVPSRGMSLLGGIVIAVFGVIWTVMAGGMGGSMFALFRGLVLLRWRRRQRALVYQSRPV